MYEQETPFDTPSGVNHYPCDTCRQYADDCKCTTDNEAVLTIPARDVRTGDVMPGRGIVTNVSRPFGMNEGDGAREVVAIEWDDNDTAMASEWGSGTHIRVVRRWTDVSSIESLLTPGTVFDTPFENGCTVIDSPDHHGSFIGWDSNRVECEFVSDMVVDIVVPCSRCSRPGRFTDLEVTGGICYRCEV